MSNSNLPTKVFLLRDYFPNVAGTEFELKYIKLNGIICAVSPACLPKEVIYNTLEEAEKSGEKFESVYISKQGNKIKTNIVQNKEWFASKEEYQKVLRQREIAEAERIMNLLFKYKPTNLKL